MRLRSSQEHGLSTIRTRSQLAFLGVIAVQAIAVLSLIIVVFARYKDAIVDETNRPCVRSGSTPLTRRRAINVYLTIFIMAEVYSIPVAVDALRTKNTIQLYGIDIFLLLELICARQASTRF